ncbi:MAG: hypothetical protein LBH00_05605 [Planctomycetaceae bacterium]|jgi:alginate O-acetyltransferase complex protein AlgI|nr:hypothetical protein [Planctomycetaceae bacterium]
MLFSSAIFLFVFLPAALFVYYVLLDRRVVRFFTFSQSSASISPLPPSSSSASSSPVPLFRTLRNLFLLFVSLFFYAWGEPMFVFVMIFSILGNYVFGLLVAGGKQRRFVITLMLLFNLSFFFVFKYLMFTLTNINAFFGTHLFVPVIMLPIGISFFTFQAVSYVLDVYRGDAEVQRNPFKAGLYIALFPQLVAGPIVRYKTIAEQIDNRTETFEDFSQGCCRFIAGLAKKVLLANTFAGIAVAAFDPAADLSVAYAWLGAAAYTLQIYFDFSGYSDMAIGLGKMFGFHFLENFNYPYIARSVSDFWRRWHISLSSWFRDYVYFPLGGSRVKTKQRLVFNLFVVWMLTGIWHGANWTYIVWGFYYFMLLTIEKLTGFGSRLEKKTCSLPAAVFSHLYTILAFVIGWVIFRSADMTQCCSYLQTMFGFGHTDLCNDITITLFRENFYFWIFGIVLSIPVMPYLHQKLEKNRYYAAFYPAAYFTVLVTAVAYLVKGTYNPFIYFNF